MPFMYKPFKVLSIILTIRSGSPSVLGKKFLSNHIIFVEMVENKLWFGIFCIHSFLMIQILEMRKTVFIDECFLFYPFLNIGSWIYIQNTQHLYPNDFHRCDIQYYYSCYK